MFVSDSLNNPRMHQHQVQQVSQYFQTVSHRLFSTQQLILHCVSTINSICTMILAETLLLSLSVLSVPSDPDEPFFILSLTEIPVCSSGEVVDSVSEPTPYLPVTDASIQQQRLVPAFIS